MSPPRLDADCYSPDFRRAVDRAWQQGYRAGLAEARRTRRRPRWQRRALIVWKARWWTLWAVLVGLGAYFYDYLKWGLVFLVVVVWLAVVWTFISERRLRF